MIGILLIVVFVIELGEEARCSGIDIQRDKNSLFGGNVVNLSIFWNPVISNNRIFQIRDWLIRGAKEHCDSNSSISCKYNSDHAEHDDSDSHGKVLVPLSNKFLNSLLQGLHTIDFIFLAQRLEVINEFNDIAKKHLPLALVVSFHLEKSSPLTCFHLFWVMAFLSLHQVFDMLEVLLKHLTSLVELLYIEALLGGETYGNGYENRDNEGNQEYCRIRHLVVPVQGVARILEELQGFVREECILLHLIGTLITIWQQKGGSQDGACLRTRNHIEQFGHRHFL